MGKAVPFFDMQYLINNLYFYQGFRLSLPSPSAWVRRQGPITMILKER